MANLTKEDRQKRELEQKEKIKKEESSALSESNTDAIKENEELKKQLSEMMKTIQSLQNNIKSSNENVCEESVDSDIPDEAENVDMNARISITSITTGGVNLKTSMDGSARHFRLDKLGQTIPIVYEHLINCINTDRWLFEDGYVYINNAKVVREQYLEDYYQKFLTPDKIENILNFDIKTIKNMVNTATTAIQETIASLVATKINKGDIVDMNKVEVIGKACNPAIDIRDLANKLR